MSPNTRSPRGGRSSCSKASPALAAAEAANKPTGDGLIAVDPPSTVATQCISETAGPDCIKARPVNGSSLEKHPGGQGASMSQDFPSLRYLRQQHRLQEDPPVQGMDTMDKFDITSYSDSKNNGCPQQELQLPLLAAPSSEPAAMTKTTAENCVVQDPRSTRATHAPANAKNSNNKFGGSQESSSSGSDSSTASSTTASGGWCWMVVLGAWLVCFLLAGFTLSFTILYQQLRQQYRGSASETAMVLASYGAVRMFSSPIVSALCNSYSHRQVALIGSIINSAAMIISGFMPSLNCLYFVFGLVGGFSSNMVYLPPFPVIGYYFEKRRGLAMALASTGCGLGGVVMAPLIEVLFRVYGYSGGMFILGGLMLNCCVGSALLRPIDSDIPRPRVSKTTKKEKGKKATVKTPQPKTSAWYYGSVASFGSFMALDRVAGLPEKDASKAQSQHFYSQHVFQSRGNHLGAYKPLGQADKTQEYSKSDPCLQICHQKSKSPIVISSLVVPTAQNQRGFADVPNRKSRCMEKVHGVKQWLHKAYTSLSEQVDLPLLAQADFVLFCFMMLGYYTCFTTTNTFISGIAIELGFSEAQVALMLTMSYALDTPSRLLAGCIFDIHCLRNIHVPIIVGLGLVAALTALLLPFPTSIPGLFVLWAVYQFLFNGAQAQQVPLIVEIVGVDKAMSACGLARVFMGVGEVIGPTMGGAIKDSTGSYHYAFYIAAASFISGLLTFQAHYIVRRINTCKQYKETNHMDGRFAQA